MRFLPKYYFLLIGFALIVSLSCDEVDLTAEEAQGEVQGFWKHYPGSGNIVYMLINESEVVFYNYSGREGCNTIDAYQIERVDGNGFYILSKEGLEENRVIAISRNAERLDVREIDDSKSSIDRYYVSDEDINSIAPICVDPTDVFGNWELELEDGDKILLSIEEDSIKVIDQDLKLGCYFISELEVIEFNGNDFLITNNDPLSSGTQEVKLTRTLEGLEVERQEGNILVKELYRASSADFSNFTPVCIFNPLEGLEGTWQYNAASEEGDIEFYLKIDQDAFVFHFRFGDPVNDPENVCFQLQKFEIIRVGENTVTIRDNNIEPAEEVTLIIEFREEEGLLYVDDTFDILTFFPTTVDDAYINNQCPDTADVINKIF